jgi:hypothetical protein
MKTGLLFALPLTAMWINMPHVPISRLIAHTESVIRQKPNDPEAYYTLGRLHSLAFSMHTELGASLPEGAPPRLDNSAPEHELRKDTGRLTKVDIDHATKSLENYKRAVDLGPNSGLYHFSLGFMQEQCAHFADQLGARSKNEWIELALAEYHTAYRLSLPEDLKSPGYIRPYLADEAGSAIIAILKQRPGNEQEIADITKKITELRSHSRGITPLIFSTNPHASLPDLLSNRQVIFDLDGFDAGRRWPWVQPDTCILVWDPDHSGRITSGRQLFGSVTWWMFWRNGYEPLAALDDNDDGILSGVELKGIAVWQDANSNGIADPGEVTAVEDFGIVEIAVTPHEVHGTLLRKRGIKLRNGTFFTTFDWTPSSTPGLAVVGQVREPI